MQTVNYNFFQLDEGDVVLDLGSGEGRHVIATYAEGKSVTSVGVDLCFEDLKTSKKRFEDFSQIHDATKTFALAVGSALKLPFPDHTFDKVICSEVLEHIPDYQGALEEINRVLKPNGLFAVSVPRYWPEKICWWLSDEYHANEGGHVRIFKARTLRKDVEQFGMRYLKRHWAHALHSPFWWLKCLFWKSQDNNVLVKAYHKLLVWDLLERPWLTKTLERCLNPLCGKSVVMYFSKS